MKISKIASVVGAGGELTQMIDNQIRRVAGDDVLNWIKAMGAKVTMAVATFTFFYLLITTFGEIRKSGIKSKEVWIRIAAAIFVLLIAGGSGLYAFFSAGQQE